MIVLFQVCNTIFEWYYVKQLTETTSNYSDSIQFSIFWQTQREMQATSDYTCFECVGYAECSEKSSPQLI